MKIAAFVDENQRVLSFSSRGFVQIYHNCPTRWECIQTIPFSLDQIIKLKEIQNRIADLSARMQDTELLITNNIKGAARAIIEDMGIGIWQFNGTLNSKLLDKINHDLAEAKTAQQNTITEPQLKGHQTDATYEMDLTTMLAQHPGLNSRDLLIPFLQKVVFKKLLITCNHPPKWLVKSAEMMNMDYSVDTLKQQRLLLTVIPRNFEQDLLLRKQIGHMLAGGCNSSPF